MKSETVVRRFIENNTRGECHSALLCCVEADLLCGIKGKRILMRRLSNQGYLMYPKKHLHVYVDSGNPHNRKALRMIWNIARDYMGPEHNIRFIDSPSCDITLLQQDMYNVVHRLLFLYRSANHSTIDDKLAYVVDNALYVHLICDVTCVDMFKEIVRMDRLYGHYIDWLRTKTDIIEDWPLFEQMVVTGNLLQ